jgi:hypothetical protein
VYANKTQESFVTSDNPVAVVVPERQGFFGPTFLQRTHYFALSPELCIEAVYPDRDSGRSCGAPRCFPGWKTRSSG